MTPKRESEYSRKTSFLTIRKLRSLYSKKYGIAHARFAHRRENIIHASTKGDHAVRYHSMHDNKYLSYFQGHTGT